MKATLPDWMRRWRALTVALVLVVIFGAGAGALQWWARRGASPIGTRLSPHDPDRWLVAGRHYLEKYPEEASHEKLAQLILENAKPAKNADDAVQAQIRDDLAKKRTVVIDGWVIARTEARLAALAALMDGKGKPAKTP